MTNLKLKTEPKNYRQAHLAWNAIHGSSARWTRTRYVLNGVEGGPGYMYKIGYNTYICQYPSGDQGKPLYTIKHFDTDIVMFYATGDIRLATAVGAGDWSTSKWNLTQTTAARMHRCTPDNVRVSCAGDGTVTYVRYEPHREEVRTDPFESGMLLDHALIRELEN